MCYTNDLEIRIFGLRRSGNHAIINWLGVQANYKPHFFNNAPNSGDSPFLTGKNRGDRTEGILKNLWYPHDRLKYSSEEDMEKVRTMHKEILIYSYEELSLKKVEKKEYPYMRKKVVGESKLKIDILILRDFVNWIASKIYIPDRRRDRGSNLGWQNMIHERFEKNRRRIPYFSYCHGWEKDAVEIRGLNYINVHKVIDIWLGYAKEILGETNILDNFVSINYNRWHVDSSYRKSIVDKLPFFDFTDMGKNVVSAIGGGSTFQRGENDAKNLLLFDRWEYLRDNKIFKDLISYHVEHMKYNNIIFGENKKIKEWLEKE